MVEPLQTREKAIVCIMYTILRPDIQDKDFRKKLDTLHSMLMTLDIHLTDNQIEEIVNMANDLMISGKGLAEKLIDKYQNLRKQLGQNIDLMKL